MKTIINTEFEAKFYIDIDTFKILLKKKGAQCIKPINLMKRWVFLDQNYPTIWYRVRDEGDSVTMTYKSFDISKTIDAVQELELKIDDFEKGCQMLELLGLIKNRYVENMREIWKLSDCLLMIDQWPALKSFVEIEGPHKNAVERVANLLEFDMNDAYYGPTARLYEQEYGISRDEFEQIHMLTFDNIPQVFQKYD